LDCIYIHELYFTGIKVVFRVGLVLIRMCLGTQEKLSSCSDMYATLEKIRHIPADIDESYIVREVVTSYSNFVYVVKAGICNHWGNHILKVIF
jgi:hypothetical protein